MELKTTFVEGMSRVFNVEEINKAYLLIKFGSRLHAVEARAKTWCKNLLTVETFS